MAAVLFALESMRVFVWVVGADSRAAAACGNLHGKWKLGGGGCVGALLWYVSEEHVVGLLASAADLVAAVPDMDGLREAPWRSHVAAGKRTIDPALQARMQAARRKKKEATNALSDEPVAGAGSTREAQQAYPPGAGDGDAVPEGAGGQKAEEGALPKKVTGQCIRGLNDSSSDDQRVAPAGASQHRASKDKSAGETGPQAATNKAAGQRVHGREDSSRTGDTPPKREGGGPGNAIGQRVRGLNDSSSDARRASKRIATQSVKGQWCRGDLATGRDKQGRWPARSWTKRFKQQRRRQ